ncbi:hypothetical protein COEREDRAFT_22386, partial [Coemansia reversa NRRL 1564]
IPKLRVRPKKEKPAPQCAVQMVALTTCWTMGSPDSEKCQTLANNLARCMQGARAPKPPKSNINWHLARLGPQV